MILTTRRKIALAGLAFRAVRAARRAAGLSTQGTFTRGGLRWHLDLHEGIDFAIFLFGSFERSLVRAARRHLRPGQTVYDIGANIGAHTLPFARAVSPGGKVIAIEATLYAFEKLQRNLAANPSCASAVAALHTMLTARDGEGKEAAIPSSWPLAHDGLHGTDSRHAVHGGIAHPTGDCPALSLDSLIRTHALPPPDWMKIDVDGHESEVLAGARQTLQVHRPGVFMELAPDYQRGPFEDLLTLFQNLGYSPHTLSGRRLPGDPRLLRQSIPPGASRNVLLIDVTKTNL